jgi:hypothetical protein
MQRKLQEKTKGSIFSSPNPFFSRDKYDVFISFEEEVGNRLPENIGLLCWYKRKYTILPDVTAICVVKSRTTNACSKFMVFLY